MSKGTCDPEAYLEPEVERALVNRLSRIEGQIRGIKKMLEDHQSCDEVLAQLAAIKNAVNGTARQLLEGHMETCVLESIRSGEGEAAFQSLKGAMGRYLKHS